MTAILDAHGAVVCAVASVLFFCGAIVRAKRGCQ